MSCVPRKTLLISNLVLLFENKTSIKINCLDYFSCLTTWRSNSKQRNTSSTRSRRNQLLNHRQKEINSNMVIFIINEREETENRSCNNLVGVLFGINLLGPLIRFGLTIFLIIWYIFGIYSIVRIWFRIQFDEPTENYFCHSLLYRATYISFFALVLPTPLSFYNSLRQSRVQMKIFVNERKCVSLMFFSSPLFNTHLLV